MTKEEIDILWHKAMRLSIEDGDQFTRYRFAELVAAAEREAIADDLEHGYVDDEGHHIQYAAAIRARGETK